MNNILRLVGRKTAFATPAVLMFSLLSGCASNDDNPDTQPAPRPEVNNQISVKKVWSESVGDGVEGYYSRLKPASGYGKLFVADREGEVAALELDSGDSVWEVDVRKPDGSWLNWFGINLAPAARVSGMVASYEHVYVGTENGQIIALDEKTGEEKWRADVEGEVLAPAIAEDGKVIVNLGSGKTTALDAKDGKEIWTSVSDVPSLTLRGVSTPAYTQGGVFVGSAGGKVITYNAKNGQLAWDLAIAKPKGATELARIVDIDATPLISGFNLYALSAGGSLSMVDIRNARVAWTREYRGYQNMYMYTGTLILSDDHSVVYAVDSRNGVEKWANTKLRNRRLTGAAVLDGYVIVGDFEGYIYFLDMANGEIKYSTQLSSDELLAQAEIVEDIAYIQTRDGKVYALRITQDDSE
ncbi:outer membrane biogenesis protein BamB [Catenovulum agarivorans DS-2]|uniref:Outer membrane protein assembly factor BamB n=1 Tax=Catenovulum agarivorans DS-2 TaxID=1328313 RepID=W7QKA9_9ALTE|nr:outer membrane protein assembly factor BamB [Catenovulum agarivorans]EWH12351.1 outer membrane biogenesis protein BamB [Catenovulum agarivorans DS-2]